MNKETIEEAAERYVNDFDLSFYDTVEEIPVKELGKKDFTEGAKWQQKQDKENYRQAFLKGHNICNYVTDNTDEADECFEEWYVEFKKEMCIKKEILKFVIPKNISEIEAAQIYSDNWEDITKLDYETSQPNEINKLDFINGVKWERERSYSEEEAEQIAKDADLLAQEYKMIGIFNNWFGQFKKK